MAVSIDWNTFVILVPRADMPVIQASPEIREFDVDAFRLELKSIEDDTDGMPFTDTHRHITETVISGFTYARLFEILSPYTVEFEDGQYTVNTTGANHNIADVKVPNQVSLIVQNSAGLINSPDIQVSSYEGGAVFFDPGNTTGLAVSGAKHPIGTRRRPVDNLADMLTIAATFGFTTCRVLGTGVTLASEDVSGFRFVGDSPNATIVTVDASANVTACEFSEMTIDGTFDGDVFVERCVVGNMNMVAGSVEDSRLRGTIMLSGTGQFSLLRCADDLAGIGVPEVDFGASTIDVIVRSYRGELQLSNKASANNVSVDGVMRLVLSTDFGGSGTVLVRGIGEVVNNGTATVDDLQLKAVKLSEAHTLLGLDPTKPLVVGPTQRDAGAEISQTVVESPAGTFTVTRQ